MDLDRLVETGDSCITEEPSACTAYCPVHVDVKAFMEELGKGDFKKAYKLLEKKMPFARIIGKVCDHPCESVCVRKNVGGTINISELERAAISLGFTPPKKAFPMPKNTGKVAVIGGGLSGIVAASELDRKGFVVTIFEKSEKLGGRLWNYEGSKIEKDVLEEELKAISNLGIEVNFNSDINKERLDEIVKNYDAVYLGMGEWEDELNINPATFQVGNSSIFAAGRIANKNESVIFSVSSAKRAVTSIERYVKKVSITAVREKEGSYDTSLKLNLDDIEVVAAVEKTSAEYSEEEAVAEAKRCLKCQCIECKKVCAHLKKYNIVPKTYARQINQNERIIMGDHYANKMINSCAECGLCKEVCPSCISMKDIIHETRESMVQREKMPPSAHDFGLKDMQFSNSDRFFLVKSPPKIPDEKLEQRQRELFTYPRITFSNYARDLYKGDRPGNEQVDFLFYPGCQLSASNPEYIGKIYQYLIDNIKEGVGLMLGCCGAPADWAGRQDLMKENIDKIRDTWIEMGKPTFVLACSSCCSNFEKYLPEVDFVSLWEMFDRYGIPEGGKINKGHVLNVHDACSTRHNNNIQNSVRKIASQLGYEIKELKYSKDKTKCCGYGGLVYFANRDQAKEFVKERVNESEEDMMVYCSMCKDLFIEGGKKAYHILDLIFADDPDSAASRKMPTLSERHKNRADLKNKLLKDLWGEEMGMELKFTDLNIIIPQNVKEVMENRYILMEDIEKVIDNAQKNKERFLNPLDGNYMARLRIDNVTYWVRYEEKSEGILVNSVYSHRMEVLEE